MDSARERPERWPERWRVTRVVRTTLLAAAVLVFLAGAVTVGYGFRHHPRTVVVRERAVGATVGAVPWAASAESSASSAVDTAAAAGTEPPPVADASTPGVALASGGVDLGNPSVVPNGSGFSLLSTQSTPFLHVPMVTAPAGGSWGTEADALPTLPSWAGIGVVTAPVVHQFGNQWVLYFTAPVSGSTSRCIGVAAASSATGPYTAAGQPLVCQSTRGGSSDASVFVDGSGTPYLVWESADHQVWSQALASDGQSLVGQPAALYRPDLTWQLGTLSSPSLVEQDGRYWLLYSAGGGFTSATDAIGYAACTGPTGPCADRSTGPLLASNSQGAGPGDPSVLATDNQDWVVYNPSAAAGGTTARSVDAVRLGFGPTGPYLATPGLPAAPAQSSTGQSGAGQSVSSGAGHVTSTLSTAALVPATEVAGTGTGATGATVGSLSAAVAGTAVGGPGVAAVEAAVSQLGVPYVWGGESPGGGFDCSGLTQWAWAQAGVSIPRTAAAQYAALPHVALDALEPGDLLFYYNLDGDDTVDHVVMYVGSGPDGKDTIIQAPETGQTVSYAPVFTSGLIGAARP